MTCLIVLRLILIIYVKTHLRFDGHHKVEVNGVCRSSCSSFQTSLHELALNQMFSLSYRRPVDSKFTGPKPPRYTMAGGHVGGTISIIHTQRRLSNFRKCCTWSGTAWLRDWLTTLYISFKSDRRLVLKLRLDITNVSAKYMSLTLCCCHLNDVICSNDFECAKITRWQCW